MSRIFSNTIFILSLLALSAFSYQSGSEDSTVGLYPSLLQFVVPTAKMNCSYISSLLNLYTQGYSEITGLSSASCIKSVFDTKVSQLQSILNNSQCVNDTVSTTTTTTTTSTVPTVNRTCGDDYVWVIDSNHAAWFRDPTTGTWTETCTTAYGCNIPYYIERYPTCDGSYAWMIGPSSGPWWIKGTTPTWSRPGGFSWNFLFIRLSAYDMSIWAITIANKLEYAKDNTATFADVSTPSGVSKIKYIDISPKDGSCYAVSSDYRVFVTAAPNSNWNEITGLQVLNLRVIANGYIFAVGKDGYAYYKASSDSTAWTQLTGQSGFTFLDVNNAGRIYGITSDHTVYTREYIGGTWATTGKQMETIRVNDDGACWGIGYNDAGSSTGYVWMRNGTLASGSSWSKVTVNGFSSAMALWGPSNHKVYWSQNAVTFDETV